MELKNPDVDKQPNAGVFQMVVRNLIGLINSSPSFWKKQPCCPELP